MSNLGLRVVSAIVLLVVVLPVTWYGGVGFRLFSAVIGGATLYEWFSITKVNQNKPVSTSGWVAFLVCAALLIGGLEHPYLLVILAIGIVSTAVIAAVHGVGPWARSGVAYAILSMIALAALRGGSDTGLITILFLFAVVWATDIMAYFCGRAVGGPKLAPAISPGKTWSGAIGGTVFGVLAGLAILYFSEGITKYSLLLLSVALSVISQAGDLFVSWIKRRFGVKDASNIIPGHGGVMDRVDGLVAAAMLLYLLMLAGFAVV